MIKLRDRTKESASQAAEGRDFKFMNHEDPFIEYQGLRFEREIFPCKSFFFFFFSRRKVDIISK